MNIENYGWGLNSQIVKNANRIVKADWVTIICVQISIP